MGRNQKGRFVKGCIAHNKLPLFSVVCKLHIKGKYRNYIKISEKKWILYARYLMEKKIKRKLNSDEVVHHINEIQTDDRIENLKLLTNSEHSTLHGKNRIYNKTNYDKIIETKRKKRQSILPKEELIKCMNKEMTGKDICIKFKMSHKTVNKLFKEYNLKYDKYKIMGKKVKERWRKKHEKR